MVYRHAEPTNLKQFYLIEIMLILSFLDFKRNGDQVPRITDDTLRKLYKSRCVGCLVVVLISELKSG